MRAAPAPFPPATSSPPSPATLPAPADLRSTPRASTSLAAPSSTLSRRTRPSPSPSRSSGTSSAASIRLPPPRLATASVSAAGAVELITGGRPSATQATILLFICLMLSSSHSFFRSPGFHRSVGSSQPSLILTYRQDQPCPSLAMHLLAPAMETAPGMRSTVSCWTGTGHPVSAHRITRSFFCFDVSLFHSLLPKWLGFQPPVGS
mmetsp:Transcript_22056/g.63238  ORF Transcript_22056/g.63238 Transcript_22056/m.63238 type:complete len:206 (+) Transcript_22056:535-1152(+)